MPRRSTRFVLRALGGAWLLAGAAAWAQAPAPMPPSAPASAASVPNTLAQRLLACAACHGANGEGLRKNEYHPRLAGKPAGYLYNQLLNFREKRRVHAAMNYMVGNLGDSYLLEIADHYAQLQPGYPSTAAAPPPAERALGATLVNEGDASRQLPACISCHGQALTGVAPAIPGLVGLNPPYIAAQMGAWKNDQRHAMAPDCMREVAQKLTPTDIAAITAWLAAQPVPTDTRPAPPDATKELPLACGGLVRK